MLQARSDHYEKSYYDSLANEHKLNRLLQDSTQAEDCLPLCQPCNHPPEKELTANELREFVKEALEKRKPTKGQVNDLIKTLGLHAPLHKDHAVR